MTAWPVRWSMRLLAIVLVSISGCASLPVPEYGRELPPSRAEHVELSAAPFFAQQDYQCGPAALATVLQSAGIDRTPAQLVEEIYIPQRQGSLQFELLA